MIFIPASEVPDLLAACADRIESLDRAIHRETDPERRDFLHARLTRARDLYVRYNTIKEAWRDTEADWCGLIRDVADEAIEATRTANGLVPLFPEISNRMEEEMMP